MSNLLSITGLTKRFNDKTALNQLNLSIESGRIVGLMGPNGAGKTTLIKTIMQVYRPDQGKIMLCGHPINQSSKRLLAYMSDSNPLFDWMRTCDAIRYYQDMYADFDEKRAADLCDFLHLDEKEKVKNLSRGMLERVLIMLTFSRKALLYLLDEPIGDTDPLGREKIIKTILSGINEDSSVLISTHLVKDVETIVDDVLFINNGDLILSETADQIREVRAQSIEECFLEVFRNA